MEIHERIKELRTAIGITQTKFARRIAVAPSLVSEMEGGVRKPNERAVRLIIAEFNVNEDWLRNGHGAMFKEDVSATVAEALGIIKSLDKNFQEGALKILKNLAKVNKCYK